GPGPAGERHLPSLLHGHARAGGAAVIRRRAGNDPRRGVAARASMIEVNGRTYGLPRQRSAVVCLDGCDPAYLEDAFERRLVPRIVELVEGGSYAIGRSQLPSFTNPNNLSIVTGAPPSVHGLPGNHYLAADGSEVQLVDPSFLRCQ